MLAHPSMSSRGKRVAGFIAIIILFLLPKRVECGYPEAVCGHPGILHQYCRPYEVEPAGFWALETVLHRNVGFAYSVGELCR